MKWHLRLAAANRGIWKASEMQRLLAERGLTMSAGKLSGLWSGQPNSIKLDELEVFCAILDCGPEELLISEPAAAPAPAGSEHPAAADNGPGTTIRPRKPQGRTPQQTAHDARPVTAYYLGQLFKGCTATLDRMRSDRWLDEALNRGPDPLHLSAVFGISTASAMRYAQAVKSILESEPIENAGNLPAAWPPGRLTSRQG